jgi:segregation and condensation protein B
VSLEREVSLVEAILFLENEPIELKTIMKISGLGRDAVLDSLEKIREQYTAASHGLELVELAGGFAFSPKADLREALKDRYGKRNEARLSRAAMETLAIIAYSQPVTRAEIETIRGVGVDSLVRQLMERSLIQEVGKKDVPGRPVQYGTTKDFLKIFRLASIADLPKLGDVDRERFELRGE